MIKLIGLKRIIILAVLAGANIIGLLSYFLSVEPMREDAQLRLNDVSGQVAELRTKISNINSDMDSLKVNLPKYRELESRGFFQSQDRFLISRTLEELQKKTNISTFSYNVGALETVPNADAANIEHELVMSRIKIDKVGAVLESDIYAFLLGITDQFPQYTRIHSFNIKRAEDITEVNLKKVVQRQPVNFIEASVTFDWMTVIPKASVPAPDAAPSTGFRGR